MLSIVLVNGRPDLLNAPNVSCLHALNLAIISIMYAMHPRRSVHQPLQLSVGIARINFAETFHTQELLRILPPSFRLEGPLVVLPQNEITVWKVFPQLLGQIIFLLARNKPYLAVVTLVCFLHQLAKTYSDTA